MARNARNGKYAEYEKKILRELSKNSSVFQTEIRMKLGIPKTSFYQIIMKLKEDGKIIDVHYKRSRLKKPPQNTQDWNASLGRFVKTSVNRKKRNLKIKLKKSNSHTSTS